MAFELVQDQLVFDLPTKGWISVEADLAILSRSLVVQYLDSLVYLLEPMIHISILDGIKLQLLR